MQPNSQKRRISKDQPHKYSSSEESEESLKNNKKINKTGKSEQKNKIVRNIFLNVSKSDGGAKSKGQVMIVGHSEDTQKPVTTALRDSYPVPTTNNNNNEITTNAIVCKIDLSRLSRVPNNRNSNLNNNDKSPLNTDVHLMVN